MYNDTELSFLLILLILLLHTGNIWPCHGDAYQWSWELEVQYAVAKVLKGNKNCCFFLEGCAIGVVQIKNPSGRGMDIFWNNTLSWPSPLAMDQRADSTVCLGHCPSQHTTWQPRNWTTPCQDISPATAAREGKDLSAAPDRWQLGCLEHKLPANGQNNVACTEGTWRQSLRVKLSLFQLRNRNHVACFYRVIETWVEVWEKKKCCGFHSFWSSLKISWKC